MPYSEGSGESQFAGLDQFFEELAAGLNPEVQQSQALGLHGDDLMAGISPISAPTTAPAPGSIYALGFYTEIGVAWQ